MPKIVLNSFIFVKSCPPKRQETSLGVETGTGAGQRNCQKQGLIRKPNLNFMPKKMGISPISAGRLSDFKMISFIPAFLFCLFEMLLIYLGLGNGFRFMLSNLI